MTIQSIAATSSYCRNVDLHNTATQFCAGVMPGGSKGDYLYTNHVRF